MKKIILASHGRLAGGMKDTVEMIAGKQDNIIAYNGYVDGNTDFSAFLKPYLNSNEEIIIITDLLGGSINKEAAIFVDYKNVSILSGMNVALVLDVIYNNDKALLQQSAENSKDMIMLLQKQNLDNKEEEF